MLTGEPWVRWPPAARSRPMKVSPGCSSARNTAWFIWLPEFGCTLAKLAAEQLLRPLDGERLGDVDELAAAVIALARIALGVFVGQHRALRLEHGARDDVLRGDQLDLVLLPARAPCAIASAISGSVSASVAEKKPRARRCTARGRSRDMGRLVLSAGSRRGTATSRRRAEYPDRHAAINTERAERAPRNAAARPAIRSQRQL